MDTIKQVSSCGFSICTSPYIEVFMLLLLFVVPTAVLGAQPAPDAALKSVTADVVAALKQDRDLVDDPAKLERLIENRIVPVFDFELMTQLAVGRNWRATSASQQRQLTTEFKAMLLRTYSGMISSYRDPEISYKPIRYVPGDTDAIVYSEVKQPGSKLLRIDYALTRTPIGWKVYDVKLDGVSVITAYRNGFTSKIRDVGVDGLIRALAEKNRQAEPGRTSLAGG